MTLQVIGAGFGRTGTHSLKLALEQLGFGPCHHMFEVRDNPEILPDWQAAARGEIMNWRKVFAKFNSQVDWPGARYWRQLAQAFPHAKVILTVRDPEAWFDSVKTTLLPLVAQRGKLPSDHLNALVDMATETVINQEFGGRMNDRSHAISVFRQRIADVQREIPPQRLLTYDVREGWTPLCAFLGVATPPIPFPHTNSSRKFTDEEWKLRSTQPA